MSREDRKAEEALKALLKQPSNRRCANCEALVRGQGAQG